MEDWIKTWCDYCGTFLNEFLTICDKECFHCRVCSKRELKELEVKKY